MESAEHEMEGVGSPAEEKLQSGKETQQVGSCEEEPAEVKLKSVKGRQRVGSEDEEPVEKLQPVKETQQVGSGEEEPADEKLESVKETQRVGFEEEEPAEKHRSIEETQQVGSWEEELAEKKLESMKETQHVGSREEESVEKHKPVKATQQVGSGVQELQSEKLTQRVGSWEEENVQSEKEMQWMGSGEEETIQSGKETQQVGSGEENVQSEKETQQVGSGEEKVQSEKETQRVGSGEEKVKSEETQRVGSGEEKVKSEKETQRVGSWEEDPAVLEWKLPQDKPDGQKGIDQMSDLEQALPQPILYHEILWRDWQDLYDIATLTDKQFDFTVLSYNILSQDLIIQNPHLYLHCPPATLHWDYRWPNILQELQHWEADILCLQEVQQDHYRDQIQPSLSALGYSCHYKRRTGRKTDGCATFYKSERFSLLYERHVEFFRPAIDVLNRDNVGLILLLRPVVPAGGEDGPVAPPALCIANTHLLYNPRRGDIKLAQLAVLLAEIERLCHTPEGAGCPIILCGDLNATPKSPFYQLLHNGVLNCNGLPAWKVSGQEQYCSLPHSRTLPYPLWPDILGINDRCQYVAGRPPKVKDRKIYNRQRLLDLHFCKYALQRPQNLPVIKGVTDKTPDLQSVAAEAGIFPDPPISLFRSPHLLQHHLQLTSAYNHFLAAKGRPEVTTFPLGVGNTVDYIFYSAEPIPICSTNHGLRFFQDGRLKLLGRLSLLSEDELWAAQGLPNPFCCSDHLCLLARFSLDLSSP